MTELDETLRDKLIKEAKEASNSAYSPYSRYPVGAAVLSFDDQIYTGANVENCGFTQTIHAEQTAVCSAINQGALQRAIEAGLGQLQFIKAIAVHAQKGTDPWPCCNCRQSLNEFGLTMDIIGKDKEGNFQSKSLDELIPNAFDMNIVLAAAKDKSETDADFDKNDSGILEIPDEISSRLASDGSFQIETDYSKEEKYKLLAEIAKYASGKAYCPYSQYPVGAAVLCFDGSVYTGCNVENCSYTQTIHAEQVATARAISGGALKRAQEKGLTQFEFIEAIAIFALKGVADPWPSCIGRQCLNEFGLEIDVVGQSTDGSIVSKKLKELIPYAFPLQAVLTSARE